MLHSGNGLSDSGHAAAVGTVKRPFFEEFDLLWNYFFNVECRFFQSPELAVISGMEYKKWDIIAEFVVE